MSVDLISKNCTYGCFLKWWYPQSIHLNRDFHHKSSILGYPYFWKPQIPTSGKVLVAVWTALYSALHIQLFEWISPAPQDSIHWMMDLPGGVDSYILQKGNNRLYRYIWCHSQSTYILSQNMIMLNNVLLFVHFFKISRNSIHWIQFSLACSPQRASNLESCPHPVSPRSDAHPHKNTRK